MNILGLLWKYRALFGAVLVFALAAGQGLYIKHLRSSNTELTVAVKSLKVEVETASKQYAAATKALEKQAQAERKRNDFDKTNAKELARDRANGNDRDASPAVRAGLARLREYSLNN